MNLSALIPACSVCFGDPHSTITKGAMAGVAFLLAVVVGVLAGIAYTAFVWARRARQLEKL